MPAAPTPPVVDLVLDSRHEFLRFTASVRIWYTTADGAVPAEQLAQLAQAAIHRRAEQVSRQYAVTQSERLRNELCVELREHRPISLPGATAAGFCTQVLVRQEDREAVERYEQTARRRRDLAQELEIAELRGRHLQPLLTDPLRATAWWLGMNESQVDSLPNVARTFAELRETLSGSTLSVSEPAPPDTLGGLVDELVDANDQPANHLLIQQLLRLFRFNGRTDLAERAAQVADDPAAGWTTGTVPEPTAPDEPPAEESR